MRRFSVHIAGQIDNFYGKLHIRTKIMLNFLAIIVLIAVSVSCLFYTKAASMIEEEITKTILGTLDQADINIRSIVSAVEEASLGLYSNLQLREIFCRQKDRYAYRLQFDDYATLSRICNSNMSGRYIAGMRLYFSHGGFYVRERRNLFSLEDAKEKVWYEDARAHNGSVLWMQTAAENEEQENRTGYVINCVRVIMDYSVSEDELGYISLELNEKNIMEILGSLEKRIDGEVFLLNSQGFVLAAGDRDAIGKPFKNIRQINELESGAHRFVELHSAQKKQLLLLCNSNPEWKLAAILSLQDFEKKNAEIVWFMAFIACPIIAAAVFMALMLSASITGRIRELTVFMKRVGVEGDSFMPEKYKDEITELVKNFNAMLKTTRRLIHEVYQVKLDIKEAELRALQAQINPHFLYNTLDAINWMANQYKAQDISKMVTLLGGFYRLSLSKGADIIPLRDELEHVRVYFKIMQQRFDGELLLQFDVQDELLYCKTVKLILQPVVENAIVHGIQEKPVQYGKILVKGILCEDEIRLLVCDNGIGIKPDILEGLLLKEGDMAQRGGYGLRNVNERIRLYFGEQYGIKLKSVYGEGTTVEIYLPALKYE